MIERQANPPRRPCFVNELTVKIRVFIDRWNERADRFVWTKSTDQVLARAANHFQSQATSGPAARGVCSQNKK
jgi:hypothetical protein